MASSQSSLLPRFPCWVQAVYSWGGETKRDLGFMEGDLIECLNAGDGSWWTGRLRRDPRMVGSFPSNFVKVLGDSFRPPPSRSPSPMPPLAAITLAEVKACQAESSAKQSSWRRPFGDYKGAGGSSSSVDLAAEKKKAEKQSRRPFSAMAVKSADAVVGDGRRGVQLHDAPTRSESVLGGNTSKTARPASIERHDFYDRTPSPNPQAEYGSRAPSPNPFLADYASPPPPPPPPHRYATSRAPSPAPMHEQVQHNGRRTPVPDQAHHDEEERVQKNTPSPFTSAYNDIMDTFYDMTIVPQAQPKPTTHEDFPESSIWSPDDYDKLYGGSQRTRRPATSMALSQPDSGYNTGFDNDYDAPTSQSSQLDDYIPRMERRLRELQNSGYEQDPNMDESEDLRPPPPPAKDSPQGIREQMQRPFSAMSRRGSKRLKKQKSAYELATQTLARTFTLRSTVTTTTNSSNSTNTSVWSGASAGQMSNTSAGSYYNNKIAQGKSLRSMKSMDFINGPSRSGTPLSGPSYHSSHDSNGAGAMPPTPTSTPVAAGLLGGLTTPTVKKSGFIRKMLDSARASAATARSTIFVAGSGSRPASRSGSPTKLGKQSNSSMTRFAGGVSSMSPAASGPMSRSQSSAAVSTAARDMGMGAGMDWVSVRRDVHRSNSLGKNERRERAQRCDMLDIPVIAPVKELYRLAEGGEGLDGLPVMEPTDFSSCNLAMVDKSARFVANLPASTTVPSLVQGYLCRPYRSDVQRLRAIFTWVSERVSWEEDFEGEVNARRVMQTKRGCSQEIALLVAEMCHAIGIQAEVVHGHLKVPGEMLDIELASRPNHWWNAVIVDGEWRIMDCALASPTNPRRTQYSTTSSQMAESWWFLARPMEICYTHVPMHPEQQHIVPPVPNEVLLSLPCACPPYFRNNIEIHDFDTSLLHLENLELAHVQFMVPEDIECLGEIEVRTYARDLDGDLFESGDVVRKPALAQSQWVGGRKRITIKAVLPGDEGQGVLKIFAGQRGMMHSIKSNPHPLALSLPIFHNGQNPPYTFLTRHPTPHAQRHDLYVAQPQCARLTANNTFVFSVRQHPSSVLKSSSPNLSQTNGGRLSPNPFARPTSAMSMASISATGSNYSNPSNTSSSFSGNDSNNNAAHGGADGANKSKKDKPAKLAIQTPSGKIIRLTRKVEQAGYAVGEKHDGTEWETVIKVGERGTWRGLVLADRSARWCVFAEWECT